MSEETATKRLRDMLDERGADWWKPSEDNERWTHWHGANDTLFTASEDARGCVWIGASLTPEQAVCATLENGTCHIVMADSGWWECDECGGSIDWDSCDPNDPPSCSYCPNCGRKVES